MAVFFGVFTFFCLAVIVFSGIASPIVIRRGIEVMGLTVFGDNYNYTSMTTRNAH